ncbi:MAG: hypothetical protein ACREV3_03495, partial [Gammaproteobacteria bacterium]
SLVTYHEHATAFETLFKKAGTNLPRFYEIAREVGQLNAQQRLHCLQGLARHGDRYLSDCLSGN